MHRTVGELLDILAPPPPRLQPIPIENRKSLSKKTPKKRQAAEGAENGTETPGEEGATPRPKKRKKCAAQDGDQPYTQTKKRPRKKKNDDNAQIDPALGMSPPEMPGARPVGDSARRSLYNTQAPQNGTAGGSAYPEGLVGGEAFNGSEAQASAMVSSSLHANSILNLPAGEAERRREAAIRLLTGSNVDPKTLSAEQFSIFANQPPVLQQESLDMLVKYGAERLRIVLPDKDQIATQNPTPPSEEQGAGQPSVVDVQQAATATESPKRNRKASRKKAEADGTDLADETAALTQEAKTDDGDRQKKTRAPRLRVSRGACTPCRAAKVKVCISRLSSWHVKLTRTSAARRSHRANSAWIPEQPAHTLSCNREMAKRLRKRLRTRRTRRGQSKRSILQILRRRLLTKMRSLTTCHLQASVMKIPVPLRRTIQEPNPTLRTNPRPARFRTTSNQHTESQATASITIHLASHSQIRSHQISRSSYGHLEPERTTTRHRCTARPTMVSAFRKNPQKTPILCPLQDRETQGAHLRPTREQISIGKHGAVIPPRKESG